MFIGTKSARAMLPLVVAVIVYAGTNASAQDATWHIGKLSGEVWISNSSVQKVSVTDQTVVRPGDNIRTGQSGRVLLMRGDESILVSPNSSIGVPTEKKDGMSTVITQRAGSILLEVEKRNVKHFEVVTPYLAAVVKGTQFRVTVDKDNSSVDVLRGQVEVSDFRSGQYALVTPGQTASVSMFGSAGLSLSGSGALGPIYQGTARSSSVSPLSTPDEDIPPSSNTPKSSRAAAPQNVAGPAVAAAEGTPKLQFDTGGLIDKASSRWSLGNEVISALSIPLGIGGFVALTVSVSRQRRKKKQNPN